MLSTSTVSKNSGARGNLPPGPRGYPVVGVLPSMLGDPFRFATKAVREFGDICKLDLGFGGPYLLGHPDFAQYVMRDNAPNFVRSGGMWDAIQMLLGRGLATTDGPFWLRQRRLMQPQFHRQKLMKLATPMIETAVDGLDRWRTLASAGKPIDLFMELMPVTIRIILKTMFSSGISDAEIAAISDDLAYCFEYLKNRMWTYFLPKWAPFPGTRRFAQAVRNIDRIIYRIINDRRQRRDEIDDLLTSMLEARDEQTGEGMTDQQIRDETMTIFTAGHETSTTALSWAYYLLCQHPEAEKKVRDEIQTVLGGRVPTADSLAALAYTRMAFQEAMRLYPPIWLVHRTSVADDEIGGYRIPARSLVVVLIYAVHHHPDFWENHTEFRPERFAADLTAKRHPCAYMPFGTGAHQCIGNHFALMESVLLLTLTLQRFRLKLVPGQKIEPKPVVTMRPSNGVWVTLESLPT